MPTLSDEIGRPGSAIKRSGEQKVIEVSFSRISRGWGGKLRSAGNFQHTATDFPHGGVQLAKREAHLAPSRNAAGSMGSATPLDRGAPQRRWIDGLRNAAGSMDARSKRCTMAATARDWQREFVPAGSFSIQ